MLVGLVGVVQGQISNSTSSSAAASSSTAAPQALAQGIAQGENNEGWRTVTVTTTRGECSPCQGKTVTETCTVTTTKTEA
jgi:hypothetical protein